MASILAPVAKAISELYALGANQALLDEIDSRCRDAAPQHLAMSSTATASTAAECIPPDRLNNYATAGMGPSESDEDVLAALDEDVREYMLHVYNERSPLERYGSPGQSWL